MQIVVFEDAAVNKLYPITVGRPAYNVGCGSYRLVDWIDVLKKEFGAVLRSVVRPHLVQIQRADFPQFSDLAKEATPAVKISAPLLLVNARMVPSRSTYQALKALVQQGKPAVVKADGVVAAALLTAAEPLPPFPANVATFEDFLNSALGNVPVATDVNLPLFVYPHDVVRHHLTILDENLAHRLSSGKYRETANGVFVSVGAKMGEFCSFDTSKGPVLLDEKASVGPGSFLRGPAYLGPNSKVIEQSAIKDGVALGHTTKIGGEVEASIVEPYTNKQHYGFLGHSYLGSWINLGAGTCNSDLKNTYGIVKMDYRGEQVSTGMQFVGCIMGDYAKSAIQTGIFTGKTVGVGSMLYGFVTTNVPSFVNYARLFGQVTELSPEVLVNTQQRMFSRRTVIQRDCDIQLIYAMYELTQHERQMAGEPLSL